MEKIISLVIIVFWVLAWSYNDKLRLDRGYHIYSHFTRYVLRGCFVAICALNSWLLGLIAFITFFCFFDLSLNLMRGLKWNYSGNTEITDRKFGFMLVPKLILLPVLFYAIIYYING